MAGWVSDAVRHNPGAPTPDVPPKRNRAGLDPYELAVLRGNQSLQGDPEAPDENRPLPQLKFGNLRVGSLGLLLGVLIITLVASGVRYGGRNNTPTLTTSCEKPGFAISTSELRRGAPLYFAVTGPARSVVVAIDATSLAADLTPTLSPGAREAQVVRPAVRMSGCKGKGEMGVQVPAGEHTIGVFPAEGGPALVTKKLTVTER